MFVGSRWANSVPNGHAPARCSYPSPHRLAGDLWPGANAVAFRGPDRRPNHTANDVPKHEPDGPPQRCSDRVADVADVDFSVSHASPDERSMQGPHMYHLLRPG